MKRIALLTLALLLTGCTESFYSENALYPGGEVASPDGRLIASYYGLGSDRAVGMADEFIAVRLSTEPLVYRENVVARFRHKYAMCLRWTSSDHLLILYPGGGKVMDAPFSTFTTGGVSITIEAHHEDWKSCDGTEIELSPPKKSS